MYRTIINNIIPGLPRNAYRKGIGAYEGVVGHATAVYAPDENQVAYFHREWNKRKSFVHFFVDWDSIRQTADMNYKGWGAGPVANQRYVHVELCETKDPVKFKESYKRYVWLLAWILHQKRLGVTDGTLVSHDWVSRNLGGTDHTDPIGYLKSHGVSWSDLVRDVKAEYKKFDNPKKEEDDKLKLENWQWKMLEDEIAKHKSLDGRWLEKARKKELTVSELSWLNTVLLGRYA